MCASVSMCMRVPSRGQKEVSDPLEVKTQSVLRHPEYVTELGSSATAASTPSQLAVFHPLYFTFGRVVSGSLSWLQTHCVSEDYFEILVFLLSSTCYDYRHAPS